MRFCPPPRTLKASHKNTHSCQTDQLRLYSPSANTLTHPFVLQRRRAKPSNCFLRGRKVDSLPPQTKSRLSIFNHSFNYLSHLHPSRRALSPSVSLFISSDALFVRPGKASAARRVQTHRPARTVSSSALRRFSSSFTHRELPFLLIQAPHAKYGVLSAACE